MVHGGQEDGGGHEDCGGQDGVHDEVHGREGGDPHDEVDHDQGGGGDQDVVDMGEDSEVALK